MGSYIARRLLLVIPMLLGLSVIVFGLLQLAPGNPAVYFLPQQSNDPAQLQRITHQLGLDQPVWVQYWHWISLIVRGNFGTAYTYGQPVLDVIRSRLAPTLELQITAITFSLILAIPVGVIAAVRRYTKVDHTVTTVSLFGLSMPDFWFALMLMLLFGIKLGILPTFGPGTGSILDRWRYFVMPVLVLGLATIPWYARFVRGSMIETLQQDYIRAARGRGVSEWRIIFKHALKPSTLPLLTIFGLSLARLVGGSVIVETIFAWPGLGSLAYESILRKDYPIVMALTLLTGGFIMLLNLAMDVVYRIVDPRIQYT
jgi:peptide/nickel transport system permease protein